MRHRENNDEEWVEVGELKEVLHELHAVDMFEDAQEHDVLEDHVTLEAIAEAVDVSVEEVRLAVARVRREEERARVAEVVRELEAPTHRVERPGHAKPDPLANHPSFRRSEGFSDLLDHLPRPGLKKDKQKNLEMTKSEKISQWISYVILIAIALGVVVLLVNVLWNF